MNNKLTELDQHIEDQLEHWIEQLGRLCAQPSISAQNKGIDECADLVAEMLRENGFDAEVMASNGYPVVYGAGDGDADKISDNKTLLFYLHYDVQPPEPLELWDNPPFEMARRDGKLFARGISDDKGHIICRLAALTAVRETYGTLPCNVKFIIEGEEEIGSPSMSQFIEDHQEKLAADACIWEFGSVDYDDTPQQSLGMRGICYIQFSVQTANQDAHSGLGGSIFPNAAWRLVWALNTLKDENENILIPGFYDDVIPPSARDLELLDKLPDQSAQVKETYGLDGYVRGLDGGLEWKKTAVFEPTCTICGLDSGYQGEGTKTVLPATATAKVDFRMVPDQRPEDIFAKLRAHLDAQGFNDVQIELVASGRPAKIDPDDPFVQLTLETAVEVYGKEMMVEPIIGGSGPSYPFVHILNLPIVSAGLGYPGGQVHAPNENIRINDLLLGIKHTARIIERFGRG